MLFQYRVTVKLHKYEITAQTNVVCRNGKQIIKVASNTAVRK